jgi:hypothetical protein
MVDFLTTNTTSSPCPCGGTLVKEVTKRGIEIKCSKCKKGYHISLNPSFLSPCENPFFRTKKIKAGIIVEDRDHDEKSEENEENDGEEE